jgi:hypothetical protein
VTPGEPRTEGPGDRPSDLVDPAAGITRLFLDLVAEVSDHDTVGLAALGSIYATAATTESMPPAPSASTAEGDPSDEGAIDPAG